MCVWTCFVLLWKGCPSFVCLFCVCIYIYIYIYIPGVYKSTNCESAVVPVVVSLSLLLLFACFGLFGLSFFFNVGFFPLLFLPCLLFLFVVVFVAMNSSSSSSSNGIGENLSFHLINFIYNLLRRNHLPLSSSF